MPQQRGQTSPKWTCSPVNKVICQRSVMRQYIVTLRDEWRWANRSLKAEYTYGVEYVLTCYIYFIKQNFFTYKLYCGGESWRSLGMWNYPGWLTSYQFGIWTNARELKESKGSSPLPSLYLLFNHHPQSHPSCPQHFPWSSWSIENTIISCYRVSMSCSKLQVDQRAILRFIFLIWNLFWGTF